MKRKNGTFFITHIHHELKDWHFSFHEVVNYIKINILLANSEIPTSS